MFRVVVQLKTVIIIIIIIIIIINNNSKNSRQQYYGMTDETFPQGSHSPGKSENCRSQEILLVDRENSMYYQIRLSNCCCNIVLGQRHD